MGISDKVLNKFRNSFYDLDLTNSAHLDYVRFRAEELTSELSYDEICSLENDFANDNVVLPARIAVKLARSRHIIDSIDKPLKISVVFAIYKENIRILNKAEHPLGEDFLVRKVSQLNWLTENNPLVKWELIIVDDGCPENSGRIAEDIIKNKNIKGDIKVLFLKDAINKRLSVVSALSSPDDSRKGGSILYGMWYAKQQSKDDNHIIIFTDADLSTHLGQCGLLIQPLINGEKDVAIGSRREQFSVVVKKGIRNNRGKLFIYLWKRMIAPLGYIVDTQCGFKAFKNNILDQVINNNIEMKFAFDIELLLKAEMNKKNCIEKVAVAWIDSEAASTTADLQPYLPMLKSIAGMYRKYLPANPVSDEFSDFIENIDKEDFDKLVDNIPDELLKREPHEFDEFDNVSVYDLKKCIK